MAQDAPTAAANMARPAEAPPPYLISLLTATLLHEAGQPSLSSSLRTWKRSHLGFPGLETDVQHLGLPLAAQR